MVRKDKSKQFWEIDGKPELGGLIKYPDTVQIALNFLNCLTKINEDGHGRKMEISSISDMLSFDYF